MLANIIGPDLLIVLGVVVLLFGGSQLPKLARSLGSARSEFERGVSSSEEPEGRSSSRPSRRDRGSAWSIKASRSATPISASMAFSSAGLWLK